MRTSSLSKRQRELRRSGIGSSEIGVLAGVSPYGSPLEIWASKTRGLEKDATDAMEFGVVVEEPVAQVYARRTGKFLRKPGTLRVNGKPFHLATPDRAVLAVRPNTKRLDWALVERLLECKSTSIRLRQRYAGDHVGHLWGEPGTDQVPQEYLVQTMWQMGATPGPVRVCDVAVFFLETRETVIYTVHFDAELLLGLQEIAERFMVDYVQAGKEPPPEASERFREVLTRLHPAERARKEYEHAGDEVEAAAFALREVEAMEALLKERSGVLRNAIRQVIGDAAGVIGPFGTITWLKNRDGVTVDYQALAAELRQRLFEVGGATELAAYETFLAKHTHVREGARVLRKNWNKVLPPPLLAVPALSALEERLALAAGAPASTSNETEQPIP